MPFQVVLFCKPLNQAAERLEDSDSLSDADAEGVALSETHIEYSRQQLHDLVSSEPLRFVRCEVEVEDDGAYGRPLDGNSPVARVWIGSWERCAQACDKDVVCIRISLF